jgi:hypothetical protein
MYPPRAVSVSYKARALARFYAAVGSSCAGSSRSSAASGSRSNGSGAARPRHRPAPRVDRRHYAVELGIDENILVAVTLIEASVARHISAYQSLRVAPQALRPPARRPSMLKVLLAHAPGATGVITSFGLTAAQAMQDGKIDEFCANGMATEIAVTSGVGNR